MRNIVFGVIGVLWGGAIVLHGMPEADSAYGVGQLAALLFGFAMLGAGAWVLSARHPQPSRSMSRRLKWLVAVALGLVIVAGGAAAWGYARESRAAGLAVKYGFAPSKTQRRRLTVARA